MRYLQTNPLSTPRAARLLFGYVLAATLIARVLIAAWLPMTGDEAYFLSWGRAPDWGFYDHPPMVGWWLAALDRLSPHPLVLRLPALIVPVVLAFAVVQAVAVHDRALAWLAGALYLLAPVNVWNVAITTDVPLMLFAGLSVLAYAAAQRRRSLAIYALCGLLLGGAMLSKYFAGLLAVAMFAHSVWRPTRRKIFALLVIGVFCLPAAALQIWWNAQHCWPNVMFNLINRHGDAGLSARTPLLFALSALYVLTPVAVMARFRRKPSGLLASSDGEALDSSAYGWLAVVPMVIFGALSVVKTIGLHWLASFTLPAVLWYVLDRRPAGTRARAAVAFSAGFALLHYGLIAALLIAPTETFRSWRSYSGLVLTAHPEEMRAALAPWLSSHRIASDGYSAAATLGYALDRHVLVFGRGSSHARHDDILTDFRRLDGADILIVRKDRFDRAEYEPYFNEIRYHERLIRGAKFVFVEGRGLRYRRYRDDILEEIRQRYYQVPRWLPGGACYFCDRYFPDRACHR